MQLCHQWLKQLQSKLKPTSQRLLLMASLFIQFYNDILTQASSTKKQKQCQLLIHIQITLNQRINRKMIKIKSDINQKLLQNFSNETFPDITIICQTRKYALTLAYLVIDSEFFNQLPGEQTEVDLSHLPEKPCVQVLRALYGDQLIVYSISQLQPIYNVIDFLKVEEYKISIADQIRKNKNLMQNLQILQFCTKYDLIADQVKKLHIDNKLRALENNKNFLMLNKISIQTLKPLLLSFYQQVKESGASIINNILENYFNRNNIKPVQFFQENSDTQILLNIWEQFHHILHIQRKPKLAFYNSQEERMSDLLKKSGIQKSKGQSELKRLKQQQAKISSLRLKIQQQEKIITKYKRQLLSLKNESGKISTRRIPSNPVLPTIDNENQTSLIYLQSDKIPKNQLLMKNIKSEHYTPPYVSQSPTTGSSKYIVNSRINYDL